MKRQLAALLLATLSAFWLDYPGTSMAADKISFGVLPVMQALPLFVAQEKGLFTEEGLTVELVTFRSGLEKDAALAAGQTQGYFGDMLTSILVASNQMPVSMVATIFNTTGDQRMFAVLAAPGTGKPSLTELAGKGIAGSSNTVIEYVTARLLQRETPGAELKMIETKNILARMPMLLQGQVAGAVLPEPLVTLVQSKGATVIADDRGLGITSTILLFTHTFIKDHSEQVRAFLKAVSKASALINLDPEIARPVMIKYARIPEPLQQSIAIPDFIPPEVPDKELVMDVYSWLKDKGILKKELKYSEMVDGSMLPTN